MATAKKLVWPMAVLMVAGSTLASLGVAAAEREKVITAEYDVTSDVRFSVESGVGSIEFVRGDSDVISVRIVATADDDSVWKDGDVEATELSARQDGDSLVLEVEQQDNVELRWTIHMPRVKTLSTDLGVGEVSGEIWTTDASIDVGVGAIEMTLFGNDYDRITAAAGIGETSIRNANATTERAFIASESEARGNGSARIDGDVGVGEVSFTIDAR